MQNIHSHLQTMQKTSSDSLLDTLIPNEILGVVFDQVINLSCSSRHFSSILLTCKKWKSVLQKNPCILLVQALFQLKNSNRSAITLQDCMITYQKKHFTSQEFKLIDRFCCDRTFKKLLMADSKLFHPKSLFLCLLDHYSWDPEVCQWSANKRIHQVAKEQLSILNSLVSGPKQQRLTVIANNSITKVYIGAIRGTTWWKAERFVISTLKNFSNFKDKKIFIQAARCFGDSVFDIHERVKKDREIVLACVQRRGRTLRNADESLKKDREIVLAAVQQDGWALEYADESLKKDREIVLAAVQQRGYALHYADESLKKDLEIVLAAVQEHGNALQYADESLKKDREIVLAAVQQNGKALQYADESLKKDREIVLAAVQQDGKAREYADDSLKKDRDIVWAAVKQYGLTLRYQYASLALQIDLALTLLLQNSRNYIFDLALYSVGHL